MVVSFITLYYIINVWSVKIPLGVLIYNKNKLDEMSKILDHLMALVPTLPMTGQLTLPNGSSLDFEDTQFVHVFMGGDQLTVARVRGTQALRQAQDRPVDRLEGLIPVVEDWHARMALVRVS